MGTSLPELVTSIVAARKNEVDMALGNVIGSNIFNILLVLGVAATISPVKFLTDNIIDTVVLIAMSLVVLVFAWTSKMIDRRAVSYTHLDVYKRQSYLISIFF